VGTAGVGVGIPGVRVGVPGVGVALQGVGSLHFCPRPRGMGAASRAPRV